MFGDSLHDAVRQLDWTPCRSLSRAECLYNTIDENSALINRVCADNRSIMNVVFDFSRKELLNNFFDEAPLFRVNFFDIPKKNIKTLIYSLHLPYFINIEIVVAGKDCYEVAKSSSSRFNVLLPIIPRKFFKRSMSCL